MRATAAAVVVGLALTGAMARSGSAAGADQRMAGFVRKTCMAGLKDPDNVERIAAAAGWPRFVGRANPSFMTVIGTWRATLDDDTVLVSIATSDRGGRPQTFCTVRFEDAKPRRAAFLSVIAAGWTLDPIMQSTSELRDELYAVRNAEAHDLTLRLNSTHDGLVVSVTLLDTR